MSQFKDKLKELGTGARPPVASLKFLSDLASEDRATLREVWPTMPSERRAYIIKSLVTLAEDNIDFDFRRVLLNALEDAEPSIRKSAIEGLSEDESTLLLGRLLTMLREDEDEEVREASAVALGRFTYLAQCDKHGLSSQQGRLREALLASARDRAEEGDVQRRAVESLGYFNGDQEVQELIGNQYKLGEQHAESAVHAMGRTMDTLWSPIILHELNNTRAAMRYEAAHAAGEMALEDALPRLAQLIDDTDLEVRLSAIWALGQIGGKPAAEALAYAAKSDNTAVQDAAKEAMEEIAYSANPLNVV